MKGLSNYLDFFSTLYTLSKTFRELFDNTGGRDTVGRSGTGEKWEFKEDGNWGIGKKRKKKHRRLKPLVIKRDPREQGAFLLASLFGEA